MGEGRSGPLPLERMLVQSTVLIASLVGGQTPSARECPPASSNLENRNQTVVQ